MVESKEAMDPSMPSISEVRGMLLALQKNLECPICLEVMKEPVSTNCAHIFCRFCTLKLLKQKKGVAQCPLCNAKVTKRSLREDVRFKQVIKVVLETVHAFERDTGLKFSEDQCFSKQAIETTSSTVPESEQLVVDSKGYRDRLKRMKAGKKGITNLNEKASMPICDGTVTRYSLRKKNISSKTVVLEVGSDSSEDTFKKTDTDRKMGSGKSSLSQSRGGNPKNQSTGPCLVNPPKPSTEDGTPLNIPGTRCFLGDGSQSIEGAQNSPEHLKIIEENVAMEKSQDLPFPHPGMEQLGKKPECGSLEEHGSDSMLTMPQLCDDVAEPTTEKEARDGADGANSMQPVGSAHILCEHKGQVLPSQTSPDNPLSPVTGKRLMRSIQKVSEWLSKSQEVLSPSSLREVQTVEVEQDLNLVHLSDAVPSSVTSEMEPMEEQEEFIGWREGDRSLLKPTVSKIEDKIFGRTYRRERKSAPFGNERERTHVQIGEGTVASTKSCEILVRKNKTRKRKATSELTPEDFIRRQSMEESSKRLVGDGNPSLEVPDQDLTLVDDRSPAEQNEAGLPSELSVKEGLSIVDTDVSEELQGICHRWPKSDLKNLKLKTRNSLGRRGKALSRSFGPLELIVDGNPTLPETSKIQVDVEEPTEVDTGQKKVRRSRRLQLLTEDWCGDREPQPLSEGTRRRSEPAKRERKQVSKKVKKERRSEAGVVPSLSVTEDGPPVLQSPCSDINLRDMKGQAGKTSTELPTSPCVAGTSKYTSVEQTPEGHSPCCSVHHAHIQSSCSPLQSLPTVMKQTMSEVKELKTHHPAEDAQGLEGNGSSAEDMTGSSKPSATADKIAAPLEPNPETDDSELDTGFVQKIFSCCKRQSFLLSTSPVKESAVEFQRKLSTDQVEGNKIHHVNKSTQNEERKTVSSEGNRGFSVQRLASSASGFPEHESKTEHLQLASQTPFQDGLSVPLLSVAKSIKGRNHSPNQKLTTDKIASPDIETAGPNGSSNNRSPKIWRNGSSLSCVNESSSNIEHFLDAGSGDAESSQPELIQPRPVICEPPLSQFSCALPEKHGSSMEQKQLSSNLVEATDISSLGVPKCFALKENLEQGSQEDSRGFELSVETPDGLLGSANDKEGSSERWAIDRSDVLALSTKTDKQLPFGRDLKNSVQCSSKLKNQCLSMTQRRQVRKLPSEEEDSSEDEELPCFQVLFGTASQSLQEKETAAEMPAPKSTSQNNRLENDEDICPSQESEGSVNLFSSQSLASGDSDNNPCVPKQLTPIPSSSGVLASLGGNKEAMTPNSKASKDTEQLKDGQQEGVNRESNLDEETLGYDSEASHLGDSSGLSSQSEIFTTQQRNAMQSNLKKLQQEMVDIEEALRQGTQHDAPKEWPLPDEEDDYTKEPTSSGKGNKVNLTPESKRGFLVDFSITVKSSHCTPDNNSTSSSKSKKQISSGLTTKAARGSPGATPGTDRRSGHSRHEIEGRLVSPFTAAACHNAKKRSPKTLLLTSKRNISLVASGLNQDELRAVQRFARKTESAWSNTITEDTTHVVMKTDEDLVCERTLKYFLGIAGQKWVVSYQWIEHSLKAGRVLNEEDFEVRGDVINGRNHQGPKRARESPAGKLFHSLEICCYGPFTDMLPEQLEWMINLCGATPVKQPHLFSCGTNTAAAAAVVVVQPDAWVEDAACPEFPLHCSATVVSRDWVLDSVASYQRQPFDDYIVQQL